MPCRVSKDEFSRLVELALADLPDQFARFLDEVPVEIRTRPSPRQLQAAGVGPNALLLGLYRGRPLTRRSVEDSGQLPDVIYIFQEPIELLCHTPDQLLHQVRTTILHEIGHLFGLNEANLKNLGYG